MFFRILKKELKKKKGINLIIFLFIIIATIFVSSSVNNIIVIFNAREYCMDMGNVPTDSIWVYDSDDADILEEWLDGDGTDYYDTYTKNESIAISQSNIESFSGNNGSEYTATSSMFISTEWDTYMQVYDQDQEPITVEEGEISLSEKEMEINAIEVGDTITITIGEVTKEFTVTEPIYDPAFGGDYMDLTRFIISEEDYEAFKDAGGTVLYTYGVETDDLDTFSSEMNKQGVSIVSEISKNLFELSYVMSMITSGILIIIGICLIIIAFLILRFTIMVSIQEDYKQIGIMKAIGLNNFGIKKIYLVKYFSLAVVSTSLGYLVSIPVSSYMLDSVAHGMMMQDGFSNPIITLLCSVTVLIVILVFTYMCTNRLKKYSPIDVIRSGETGERYNKKSLISLHKRRSTKVSFFLATNDILSNFKKYRVLVLTFIIGTILIIIPLNAITTIQSDEMGLNFVLDPDADFFISSGSVMSDSTELTKDTVIESVENVEEELSEKGYDGKVSTLIYYNVGVNSLTDTESVKNIMSMQFINSETDIIEIYEGSEPEEENEIAMSDNAMDELGVSVGDYVEIEINNVTYKMLITGAYSNYMQLGVSFLFSDSFSGLDDVSLSGLYYYQVDLDDKTDADIIDQIQNDYPDYEFSTMAQVIQTQLGDTVSRLNLLKNLIVIIICAVNILITILMMKIFMAGEKGQLAMMRNIGFSIKSVRISQTIRMGIVLIIGIVTGTIISIPLNSVVIRPIFALMGANRIKIQVDPFENYILFPGILLIAVIVTAYLCSGSIKKLNLMEINNVE